MTMNQGIIFDIKEFAVFDGPGIRSTVFLKGCPLRCMWCHNPEGLNPNPEKMVKKHSVENCGEFISVSKLSSILLKDKDFYKKNQGGVTFSGGEPLFQAAFLYEVLQELNEIHTAIETSGFCTEKIFEMIVNQIDLVIMDLKLMDSELHRKYTGVDNSVILKNLETLKNMQKPFIIRIPLIPGVNDTRNNLEATAAVLEDAKELIRVELLPYHRMAGAKYSMVGRAYEPSFQENVPPSKEIGSFLKRQIPCIVL